MNRIVLLATCAVLAPMLGLQAPAASAQYAAPTRDVENPARTAFAATATLTVDPGFIGFFDQPFVDVPAGTRLVIEFVSVSCSSPSGNVPFEVRLRVTERTGPSATVQRDFWIPLELKAVDLFSSGRYVGALSTRIYADPGLEGGGVTGGVGRSDTTGTTSCSISLSGHTVSMP